MVDISLSVNGISVNPVEGVEISTWHPGSTTDFRVDLQMQLPEVKASADLGEKSTLGIYITVKSSLTGLREISPVHVLSQNETDVLFSVPSEKIGGKLVIKVILLCIFASNDSGDLAPSDLNQLLDWMWVADLEGEKHRGAVFEANFPETYGDALWHIEVFDPENLDSWKTESVNSAIRVYINKSKHLGLREEQSWNMNLVCDYMWALTQLAARDLETLRYVYSEGEESKGSLIATALNCLRMNFPIESPEEIYSLFAKHPLRARSIIQSNAAFIAGMR